MSKMHPKSDAIYDPKTGEILKYSELLKGNKGVMPSGYSMHPQSGTLLAHDGTELDLVELLLGSGGSSPGSVVSVNGKTGEVNLELEATDDKLKLKIRSGSDTTTIAETSVDIVTDDEIDAIIDGLQD